MVSSRVYPGLERKPGGPDNWVERAGGLPSYIERIAKHLHYEKGRTISAAIATAVNTVKRWARGGTVTKYGTIKRVSAKTIALAQKALAEWEAKRVAGKLNLSEEVYDLIDMLERIDLADGLYEDFIDLADTPDNCDICDRDATQKVLWADGRAYVPSCDKHVRQVQMNLTKKNGKMTELAGTKAYDLADAEISGNDTMVALIPPKEVQDKIAVTGGVPASDLHVTVLFYGELDDPAFEELKAKVHEFGANWEGGVLKGTIGGIGCFPAQDEAKGQPWWVPVDVPGINTLHEQLRSVTNGASEDHGYSPHMTLTYTQPGDEAPTPVESTPVEFASVWVVRGNTEREEISLGAGAGAEQTDRAILSAGNADVGQGGMKIADLAERANSIADPAERATARQKVLDLAVAAKELTAEKRQQRAKSGAAMPDGTFPIFDRTSLKSAIGLARTPAQRAHVMKRARTLGLTSMIPEKWTTDLAEVAAAAGVLDLASTIAPRNARGRASDGRRSYKGQGKFKHGFIPLNRAAKEAKAKGSPIAIKRLNRLFGSDKVKDDTRKNTREVQSVKAATGRTGNRSASNKNNPRGAVTVDEGKSGSAEKANSIGLLRNSAEDFKTNRSDKKASSTSKEASKESRIPARAKQNWDEIPDNLKTVRNGERYVLAEFGGKGFVTPWVGGVERVASTALKDRKVMRTLASADAANMSQSELRALVNNPQTPDAVKKVANRTLRTKFRGQA